MTTVYAINLSGEGVDESDAQSAYEACVASLWAATDAISAGGDTPKGSLSHSLSTVEDASALTPDAWASGTAYSVGALVTKVVTNGHFYEAISAGTSHASVEPTFPTNGGTVADGSTGLVWKDQGLIAPAVTKGYSISIAGRGVSSSDATSAYETLVLALRAATDVGATAVHGTLDHTGRSEEQASDV